MKLIKDHVLTITSDNGKEFAYHQEISRALKTDFYFAHPYLSWQQGLNEQTNGLIREYFPKETEYQRQRHYRSAEQTQQQTQKSVGI